MQGSLPGRTSALRLSLPVSPSAREGRFRHHGAIPFPVSPDGWSLSAQAGSRRHRPRLTPPRAESRPKGAYFFVDQPLVTEHAAPQRFQRTGPDTVSRSSPRANASGNLARLSGRSEEIVRHLGCQAMKLTEKERRTARRQWSVRGHGPILAAWRMRAAGAWRASRTHPAHVRPCASRAHPGEFYHESHLADPRRRSDAQVPEHSPRLERENGISGRVRWNRLRRRVLR